jgi:molecular chaperone IbpA
MTFRFNTGHIPQLTSWVGFDRMFDELERVSERTMKVAGWPPYNVKKIDESHYTVEIACAGFSKSDIDITMKDGQLVIKGEVKSDPTTEYLYKGIAERSFERSFTLADSVIVKNASMLNGMLRVALETFIPEEKRAKKIEINDEVELNAVIVEKQLLTE